MSMADEEDLSQEWIERERPPTIRFNGTNSLSGSVNVLNDKPGNWVNVQDIMERDIFTNPKTGLERMFMQPPPPPIIEEGPSDVEEESQNDKEAQQEITEEMEQNTAMKETEARPGTVRSTDGMVANFSFPFRPESQARQHADEEISQERATDVLEAESSPVAIMTPRQPAKLAAASPVKSPLKLFHNEYDTFTNDKLSDMINILGSRPPVMQKVSEQSEPISEGDDKHDGKVLGTGKSHQSAVSAQTQLTDHDMGPERKRLKHEPKGSITTQNFYSNANDVMARLRMKGGGLGKGLPRLTEDRTSTAGSLHAGTTPHPRKVSGGLLSREDDRRRSSTLTVPEPSGFEAMNIPVDKFAGTGFGARSKSHFSDWTSEAGSRTASNSTVKEDDTQKKDLRMYDSVKQTWITTPARMSQSVAAPQQVTEQTSPQSKRPQYQNIPPNPNITLRNGDMVFSASRLEWRHISEGTEQGTFVRDVSHSKHDLQGYPDELELSSTETGQSISAGDVNASMRSLPAERRMPAELPEKDVTYGRAMTKVSQRVGDYDDDYSDLSGDLSLSRDSIDETMSQSTADLVEAISKRYSVDIWERVAVADLSGLRLRSLTGLFKCFPNLTELDVSNNQLSHLQDLPDSLLQLNASQNQLDALTSFSHLPNLQSLKLNNNQLEDLDGLGRLSHLHHLEVDHNALQSLTGLESLPSLVTFSAKYNQLPCFEVQPGTLQSLEVLDLSHNQLEDVRGLAGLPKLLSLNVDHNRLQLLDLGRDGGLAMPQLKMLSASDNDLWAFDMQQIPNVRTLYLDDNSISELPMLRILQHIQCFSLRRQRSADLLKQLDLGPLQEVERLYLSGNAMHHLNLPTPFLSLKYLELAGCHLTDLPENLSSLAPNMRVLNLCGNNLTDVSSIANMRRLERLLLHGNKLKKLSSLSSVLQTIDKLKVLDVRGNPATAGFYSESTAVSGSQVGEPIDYFANFDVYAMYEGQRQAWQTLDNQFKETMTSAVRERREAYQQLIWSLCRSLRWHDGKRLSKDELILADRHLETLSTM